MIKILDNIISPGKTSSVEYPFFAVGTGRCGTHFFFELLKSHQQVDSFHIQDLNGDSFYRFCAWYNLPVDQGALIHQREYWLHQSQEKGKLYFESNPYLSFHLVELHRSLKAKFIFIIRNPVDVVRSHIVKGWYEKDPILSINGSIPGYQYGMPMNHFLGRMIPTGNEFDRWSQLTRVGQLAWMWNTVNLRIWEQLEQIGKENSKLVKIEELNFKQLQGFLDFMGVKKSISESKFLQIKNLKPGKGKTKDTAHWNQKEMQDFELETQAGRKLFGY